MRAQSTARRAPRVLGALLLVVAAPVAAQPKAACTPVAARQLARGIVLTLDDIAEPKNGSALCAQRAALVGSQTRRVVNAGEPLREPAIAAPSAIEYGQPVTVVYRDGGIEVRLKGVAANAAPLGGRVSVRVDSRRRLDGVAAGPGLVQMQ